MPADHKPIAFFIRQIDGTTPHEIMRGALAAAEANQRQVLFVQGGVISKDSDSAIYEQLDPATLGGVISWASVENDVDAAFYRRFTGIPVVLLTVSSPGLACISIDTYSGQKTAIKHLIETHGYQKIAFIRGPENHAYAQARYQAYQDALADAGIRLDSKLVSAPGNWTGEWGVEAVAQFLEAARLRPGRDFQALACANDNIAIGAVDELRRRSIQVPLDVAVIGYNNSGEAVYHNPPLTTVRMPFYRQGYEAVSYLAAATSGRPQTLMLDSELMVRQSCGCHSRQVLAASLFSPVAEFPLKADVFFDEHNKGKKGKAERNAGKAPSPAAVPAIDPKLIQKLVDLTAIASTGDPQLVGRMEKLAGELLAAYWSHGSDAGNMEFLSAIDRISNLLLSQNLMIDPLHDVVSTLRGYYANQAIECRPFLKLEDIASQSRVVISESSIRQRELNMLNMEKKNSVLQAIGLELMTALDEPLLFAALRKFLPRLKITEMSLILRDAGGDQEHQTQKLHTLLGSIGKGLPGASDPAGHALAAGKGIPAGAFATTGLVNLLLQPMRLHGQLFGYCLFGINSENLDGLSLSSLKNQISNNRFSSHVNTQNDSIRQRIEDTLEMMTEKVTNVARRSGEIKDQVQSGSSAMEELAAEIKGISKTVHEVNSIVDESKRRTDATKSSIDELVLQIQGIRDITLLITDIAERTNLLSLNASIEAAHAGSAGADFSVVAKEVKNLAFSTVESASRIKAMISTIQQSISVTADNVGRLNEIIPGIVTLSATIDQAISEQEIATKEISHVFLAAADQTREISSDLEVILGLRSFMNLK